MILDTPPFDVGMGLIFWAVICLACAVLAVLAGLAISLASLGLRGPAHLIRTLSLGFRDLTSMAPRRFLAIANLTFKEAYHRKAFMVFVVFILLFSFGPWFLSGADADKPAKVYVSFAMTSIRWLLIPMALLVSCWGLPADIKDRSLHTVVTKPVRRSEIVLGRMLGYIGVVTLVLLGVSLVFYVWIYRLVPAQARDQLVARVPVYGDSLQFYDREGNEARSGMNVGDMWAYRGYIEGLSKCKADWTFSNLDVAALKRQGKLRLEQKFEAFRTYKGDVNEQIRYSISLLNPNKKLDVKVGTYPVEEFSVDAAAAVVEIPETITYRDTSEPDAPEKTVNLFDDLIDDGKLLVSIACVDAQQFVGVAQNDLFIRMPDNSFAFAYFKGIGGLWLMLVLIVTLGTTASCFLKGPVATMLTASLIILGQGLRSYMYELLGQLYTPEGVIGGGPLEAMYRLATQMNVQSPLPENPGTLIIKWIDMRAFDFLLLVQNVIPNFSYFDMNKFVANGFDVSWSRALLPSLATTCGFFIPLLVLGYFSLQLRELESK